MPVLSRREGQRIILTDLDRPGWRIVLGVVEIKENRVRLTFEAPDAITIMREEVTERPGYVAPA